MNQKSFCPQCTEEWDRPWYDICPHCNYRFKGYPWWQAPSLIVLLVCLPAMAVVALVFLAKQFPSIQGMDMEGLASVFTFVGGPVGAIIAALIMVIRAGRKGVAILGWWVLWAIVFVVLSLTLCFFSFLYAF